MEEKKIDIFCDVIDNYGDAGFSLRLARSLRERGIEVNLFCNNLKTLYTITNHKDMEDQKLKLSCWPDPQKYQASDTVIEAFSCRLPDELNQKLLVNHALVIEIDYLTAEKFAEDCHGLSSSADGLNSYFFFPGFSPKTGGLIVEKSLVKKIHSLQQAQQNECIKISLFSYKNQRVESLLHNLQKTDIPVKIKVFEGLALDNLNKLLKSNLKSGEAITIGNLEINAISMCAQNEFDDILLSSNLNCVRGEESVVRAMLCGKPFLWQIYPQQEQAHIVKLNSFFDRMEEFLPCYRKDIQTIRAFNLEYNGVNTGYTLPKIHTFLPTWEMVCSKWSSHLLSLGSLTDNLIDFINSKKMLNINIFTC